MMILTAKKDLNFIRVTEDGKHLPLETIKEGESIICSPMDTIERKLDDDSTVEMLCFSFKRMYEDPNMNKFYTEYPSVEEILEDFNIKSIVVDGSTDSKLFRNYISK